jgi:pimeloyl-ACP methyl ester carboxylesterase
MYMADACQRAGHPADTNVQYIRPTLSAVIALVLSTPARRTRVNTFTTWIAAAGLAVTFVAGHAAAAPAEPVKNVVLVHGAFADGSSWAKVIKILQAKGYNVTAVQIPLSSFADDVAATNRALARQTGPVILVGHSWGGAVITETGMDTKVVGLVYVAAFGPDVDEVVGDIGKAYPPPPAFTAPIVDQQGFMTLPTDAVVKHFASDLPPDEARIVAATQGPVNVSAFATKVSTVAWKTKPSWYIVSKLDGAIAPDEERFFAKRMKATTTELNTSHVPMLSKPNEVAAVIMDAATKAPH